MLTYLVLENGTVFKGKSFGKSIDYLNTTVISGEIVFQTGMVGYAESLTDPSYKNQILVMTYPLIGNYGINSEEKDIYGLSKYFESNSIHPSAVIIGSYDDNFSHHLAETSFKEWLINNNTTCVYDIDTRKLTKIIREHGTMTAKIVFNHSDTVLNNINNFTQNNEINLVDLVSTKEVKIFKNIVSTDTIVTNILVIDCGIKHSQLKILLSYHNVRIIMVPWDYDFTKLEFDKIFISNGPGNPEACDILIQRLKTFMESNSHIPIFGICLGHQILALAGGLKTRKMKYGNRGVNIPCRLVGSNRCYITSQNHGYEVYDLEVNDLSKDNNEWDELFVNANDGTNEGIIHKSKPYFSVQFHPEAAPGVLDTVFLFDIFMGSNTNYSSIFDILRITKYEKPNYKKVLILGSGGLTIGQSGEFDYSGSQAIKAFKEEGLITVLINPNIATVQTSPGFADKVYFLPITPDFVTNVIKMEMPDCIALSFGGQTALNCGIALYQNGILDKYNIKVLGTPVDTIINTEDRGIFKRILEEINESVADGFVSEEYEEAFIMGKQLGFPLLVRSGYALGGLGSGFANNEHDLERLLNVALNNSSQVIIDKSLRGWKEIEYEIVRDAYDNCISVCNMENIDPLGIHTGESMVVAPSQTLSNHDYYMLRDTSIKIIRHLGIVGECNIQYALDPHSSKYYVIEVNARLSRSSALASKATGYPLAYIAAKLGLGYALTELKNRMTNTSACFEPSLDYCVVKIPRWDLNKFPMVDKKLGSSMKSIGEAMGIGRSFEEAFQKALRMANDYIYGLEPTILDQINPVYMKSVYDELINPTPDRIFVIATVLYDNMYSVNELYNMTNIDKWFLHKFKNIIDMHRLLENNKITKNILYSAKKLGFSDAHIAKCAKTMEVAVRHLREKYNIYPVVKQIDTVAGEFPCFTNYLYTTYNGTSHDTQFHDIQFNTSSIIVLGSGVYKIGSSVEFDWCAVHCVRELKKLGENVIVINCNPETVSTDYDEADKLYFDELSFEVVMDIYHLENPKGIILSMGGQIPNNIAMSLYRQNVNVIGTSPEMIDCAENRYKFSRLLDNIGVDQPIWKELTSIQDALEFCNKVEYPCLIRPSYVLSGAAMNVAYSDKDLVLYLGKAVNVSKDYPVVISKFINDAKEIEVDAVASNGKIVVMAISEHIENAGVHSGDATLILPPQDITKETIVKIKNSVYTIALALHINGPFNIQFIAKEDKVKVIECNLRVSRSFPFVSKTLNTNFIHIATRVMMGLEYTVSNTTDNHTDNLNMVGIKIAQFSFDRLKGADVNIGVDMLSTGEVACFGRNKYEAFLKAMLATPPFKIPLNIPYKYILVSIGSYKFKNEFLDSMKLLQQMNYQIIGTAGTVDFYKNHGINIIELPLYSEDTHVNDTIIKYIQNKKIDLIINISQKNKMRSINDPITDGYRIRTIGIQNGIYVMTDIKKAKLLITSLKKYFKYQLPINTSIDCFTSYKTIRLPGLIDVHVHVREPGNPYKEDWQSVTKAAIAGGITMINVMPNTNPPIIDESSLDYINDIAKNNAFCDYTIFAGASTLNKNSVHTLGNKVSGLKMYLNLTYGDLLLNDITDWMAHVKNWDNNYLGPICVHAESKTLPAILYIASLYNKRIHVCHLAKKEEIELIRESKKTNMNITCEVAPHHLFMDHDDLHNLGIMGTVRPPLMTSENVKALWDNMDIIDCFATDHAPHTKEDKIDAHNCHKECPGFPGLETALPLLLTAVNDGLLTIEDIVLRYYTNPKKIFNLPTQEDTYIEVDMDKEWIIPDKMKYSKCGWTPFTNRIVKGIVKRVVVRGKVVFVDGNILVNKCYGQNLRDTKFISTIDTTVTTDIITNENNFITQHIQNKNYNNNYNSLNLKNIFTVKQFNRNMLRTIFQKAKEMKSIVKEKGCSDILHGKVLATIFYEPSTRTRCSFSVAMKRLGGEVIEVGASESSVQKGETIEDFVRCLECYSDIVVIRTPEHNSLNRLEEIVNIPIINAGDGVGEHPTQAILDVYTIREERGTVNSLTITMIGDLKNGRTVHSLAILLCLYDVRLNYVSPPELRMPKHIKKYVESKGIEQTEHTHLEDILEKTDILYVTRIQKERFTDEQKYNQLKGYYIITPEVLTKAKHNLVIMHPLPRVDEISTDIDKDPRAAYFRQMENGMYVRMALLSILLN